jgi:hypothetical protein
MAIGIGVRRLTGLGLGTGWLKRSARPYCQRGDEPVVKRHKLALELEMQHGSAQRRKNSRVAWVLREATRAKAGEPKKAREVRFPRILKGIGVSAQSFVRVGEASSPYRTSHSVAM